MTNRTLGILTLFVVVLMAAGCVNDTEDEFSENRATWKNYNFSSYSYHIENIGLLPPKKRVVFVRNNAVDSVFLFEDSVSLPDSLLPLFAKTIDGLFDEVQQSINSEAKTTVRYNSTYGYPEQCYRDQGMEGDGFIVSEFSAQ